MSKKVTIDDLAIMMQREFTSLHEDITGVKQDIALLDGRMDQLDGRMDRLDGRMDRLDGRMENVEFKLDMLAPQSQVDELGDRVGIVETDIKALKLAAQ